MYSCCCDLTLILYEAAPFADGHHISYNVHVQNGMVENAVHTCNRADRETSSMQFFRLSTCTVKYFMCVHSDLQSWDTPAEPGHHKCSA